MGGIAMYEYKTETLSVSGKFAAAFLNRANEKDAVVFNEEFIKNCTDGWELLTYTFMSGIGPNAGLLVTYRREKK